MRLHFPAGTLAGATDEVDVQPPQAGWDYTGLRILELEAGSSTGLELPEGEAGVFPLNGGCSVVGGGYRFDLANRESVFAAMPDCCYLPRGSDSVVSTETGVRLAIATALATEAREPRFYPAATAAVELRGAGPASRQINQILGPGVTGPQRLIVVEVLVPGGNWSSYPPHKHDEWSADEVPLEEIYYFEIRGSAEGFGVHRTYTTDGAIDTTVVVRSGDVFLVPRGYHGPTIAAPGYDMYYLNVMAGPDPGRRWKISTDPAHAWLWERWKSEPLDPRLPFYKEYTKT